jgi:hypothetical protein
LADNLSPQGRAQAQLLYQQTQGADIANERAYTQQMLDAAAARNAGGILATGGADAQPPGGVPGAVASLAQPPITGPGPGGRYPLVDTTGMTPNQTYMAGRLFTGMSPGDLTTAINLGRDETLGAGQDFSTLNAQHAPVSVSSGVSHYIDPTKGNAPGNVISGPDPYQSSAIGAQAPLDVANADVTAKRGDQATTDSGELAILNQLYDKAWNTGDSEWATIASDQGLKALAAKTPIDFTKFSSRLEALAAIRARMLAMIGSARASQGDPALRGGLDYMANTLPNPDLPPEQFHGMADAFGRVLQQQIAEGRIARQFQGSPMDKAHADIMRNGVSQARAAALADLNRTHPEIKTVAPDGTSTNGSASQAKLPPADSGTVARARVKLRQANNDPAFRKQLIDAGRANGVDLEAGGF